MPVNGCVSGCAPSIKCHGRRLGGFLLKACTPRLGLSGLLSGSAAFRERSRDVSSGSRMREIRMSGSTSGMWKRSMVRIMRHRQTKEPETDRPDLTHRATSRLYTLRCNVITPVSKYLTGVYHQLSVKSVHRSRFS